MIENTEFERFLSSKERVASARNKNLIFLLKTRYDWVKQFISRGDDGLELGAGAGHSKVFMEGYKLITTDIFALPWLDKSEIDAQNIPFENESFDYVLVMNVLHHLDTPVLFFREASRVLKKGGKLIVFEPYDSWLMRMLIRLSGTEHCNRNAEVFSSEYHLLENSKDMWDGNNSTGRLFFKNPRKFLEFFGEFELIHKSYAECIIFANSGGVYVKSPFIPFSYFLLKFTWKLDTFLAGILPEVFALAIRVVLQKK